MMKFPRVSGGLLSNVRKLGTSSVRMNVLPSSKEMRSDGLWKNTTTNNSGAGSNNGKTGDITRDVVGIARSIQENTQPPLDIAANFTKKFTFGDSYDPFDFSNTKLQMERKSYNKSRNKITDPFERTGIDPRNLYAMPEILSRFITSTGQILPRSITGCNGKNQKRLSDAIKTARACGLLSSTHKHARYLPSRNL